MNNAEIIFFELSVFELLVKDTQTFRIFCGNDDSARVSVNSVDKGGSKGVFILRIIVAFFIKIPLDSCYKRVVILRFVWM